MFERDLPSAYRSREPTLQEWVELGHQPDAVKRLLSIVSKAFRLSETDGLRLRPDDQVWMLYHCYNPRLTGWRRWIGSRP
jgi:hypothetical protein